MGELLVRYLAAGGLVRFMSTALQQRFERPCYNPCSELIQAIKPKPHSDECGRAGVRSRTDLSMLSCCAGIQVCVWAVQSISTIDTREIWFRLI